MRYYIKKLPRLKSWIEDLTVDQKILQKRFKKLGWTNYRLAAEVSKIRSTVFGEKEKKPSTLVTSVANLIENPNSSSFKNVEAAIRAMGGEIVIRWQNVEEVVTGYEDVKL